MMRNIFTTVVGLLALLVAVACVPIPGPGETGAVATVAPQSVATPDAATSTPPATSEPPTPAATEVSTDAETPARLGENVAVLGVGRASTWSDSADLVIDGDLDTMWSAALHPVQWFSVILDDFYLVDRVEMVVAQTPAGPTTHEIWLGNGSGVRTLYERIKDVHTEDGQILEVTLDPPRTANEVLIRTVHSPSWVAWREVRVFGQQTASPAEEAGRPRLKLKKIATGLDLPVQVTHASDGSGRLFVVEQKGRIRIVKDGVINDTSFLDLSERISCCGERGLLGIAFPPNYAAKQHLYVSYTNVDGHTTISRYATTADPDRADPDSEEIVLTIDQPDTTHNGGRIVFGPQDGYLYIGSGDGVPVNDPENRGQDPGTWLGKILRIDVESGVKPYGIPADNPFTQVEGYRDEIWALGLRNPWGFAFDKETGALYIPDVGNSRREEVNYQPAGSRGGENYGWRIMEGILCFQHSSWPCNAEGLTSPVAEYEHLHGCAIVGGVVYSGIQYPFLQGVFIYADFCSGRIWGLNRPDAGAIPGPRVATEAFQDGWQSTLLLNASVPVSSIGEDEEGNVYITGFQDGVISMIIER